MIDYYSESQSEIQVADNQSEFETNQFDFIIKPQILVERKYNKFDHQYDLQSFSYKETQITNQVHKNHFKAFRNNFKVRFEGINMNFIRAIKRELKYIHSEYFKNKCLWNSKSSLVSNNELFVWDLLENTSVRWADIKQFRVDTLSKYVIFLPSFANLKASIMILMILVIQRILRPFY